MLFVALLATSCSTPRLDQSARFSDEEHASLIVRYYTDDTSYVLKPLSKDGLFLTVLNKDAVVDLARKQPERGLAVVVLIHYCAESEAETVKDKWRNLLGGAGYRDVIFLRGRNSMQVNGLPILASRS